MIPTTKMLRMMSPKDRKSLGKAGMLPEEVAAQNLAKSEGEIQDQIYSYLTRHNIWFAFDGRHRKRTGKIGQPDFLLVHCGAPVAFEVKMPGKEPDEEQRRCHDSMRLNGWHVLVVFNLREVIDFLDRIKVNSGW